MAALVLKIKLEPFTLQRQAGLLVLPFSALICALLIVKPVIGFSIAAVGVAAVVLLWVFSGILAGKVEPMMLMWALAFPLGYYFLTIPSEKGIITLDRLFAVACLAAMALAPSQDAERVPDVIRRCATSWGLFLAVAAISLAFASNILTSIRALIDSFCLPALLAWCVFRNFQVRQHIGQLHVMVSLMAIYTAGIGAAEMVLGQDLFPMPGSALAFRGSVPRPSGPFYSDDSFALIGLVTFFLLSFLRNALGDNVPTWRRMLHWVGSTAALAMSLMPMFRSIVLTLMLVMIIEALTARKHSRRVAAGVLLVSCLIGVSLISVLAPDAYEDRRNPDNVYARMGQHEQTLRVFLSHPVLGVGLTSFTEFVSGQEKYLALYKGVGSVNSPHNNLGQILAETGALGFVPYVASVVMTFLVFWRLRKRNTRDSQLVSTSFLYLFLSYWLTGMTEASGYSSDLNLWYMFALAVLYKYAITERIVARPGVARPMAERGYGAMPLRQPS